MGSHRELIEALKQSEALLQTAIHDAQRIHPERCTPLAYEELKQSFMQVARSQIKLLRTNRELWSLYRKARKEARAAKRAAVK